MRVEVEGASAFVHTGDGPADGAPVVLVHGAGMDHSVFRYQTRALGHHGLRSYAPDLPGHGRTPGPVCEGIPAMAVWIAHLVEALGVGPVHVVGHSMGSLVAMDLAAGRPEMVRSMVLFGTARRMAVHPELQAAADQGSPVAIDLIVGWMHRGDHRLGGHPDAGVWSRGVTAALLRRGLGGGVLASDLRSCSSYDTDEALGSLGCPTLVVAGGSDRMTPASGQRQVVEALRARGVPVEHVEVSGGSHNLHFDDPLGGAAAMVRFLEAGSLP